MLNGVVYGGGGSEEGGTAIILDGQIYSTDEQQVGVWTDGKPIYRKTYPINPPISIISTASDIASYIDNESEFENIIDAVAINTDNTYAKQSARIFLGIGGSLLMASCADGILASDITIWYTKNSDSAGSGGYQAYGFSPIIYSEEEREVGVWKDGRPLYQKTWELSSPVTVSSNTFTALTTIGSEVQPIRFECMEGDYTAWQTTSVCNNTANGTLDVLNIRNRSIIIKWFTLWYVKSTDTAGSGKYNTLSVPNVHYTTSEQVIGTWIDGKPIYQKTLVDTTALTSTEKTIDITALNVDEVVDMKGYILSYWENKKDMTWIGSQNIYFDELYDTYFKIKYASNYGRGRGQNGYVITLQYTKTTD